MEISRGVVLRSADSRASSAVAAVLKCDLDLEHLGTSASSGTGRCLAERRGVRSKVEERGAELLIHIKSRGQLKGVRDPALASKLQLMVIGMIMNGRYCLRMIASRGY